MIDGDASYCAHCDDSPLEPVRGVRVLGDVALDPSADVLTALIKRGKPAWPRLTAFLRALTRVLVHMRAGKAALSLGDSTLGVEVCKLLRVASSV